jgi:hypothetical protein
MVFESPKRHRIITVRDLLEENEIPVTSIKLSIQVQWSNWIHSGTRSGEKLTVTREKRNELNVPIEEFDDPLNDAQTFELYVDEEDEEAAIELIDECDEETFFGDCIFKSQDYALAFEVYRLFNRNNIPCDDVFPGDDAYLLFVDPEHIEKAIDLMMRKFNQRV